MHCEAGFGIRFRHFGVWKVHCKFFRHFSRRTFPILEKVLKNAEKFYKHFAYENEFFLYMYWKIQLKNGKTDHLQQYHWIFYIFRSMIVYFHIISLADYKKTLCWDRLFMSVYNSILYLFDLNPKYLSWLEKQKTPSYCYFHLIIYPNLLRITMFEGGRSSFTDGNFYQNWFQDKYKLRPAAYIHLKIES